MTFSAPTTIPDVPPASLLAELDAAAHRVEPDDLALLAMLVDRTPPADVADALAQVAAASALSVVPTGGVGAP